LPVTVVAPAPSAPSAAAVLPGGACTDSVAALGLCSRPAP
jgi:hypothetical protein